MAYITVADLRSECFSETEYPNDAHLEARIRIAQALIDQLTRRFFEVKTGYKLLLDGNGRNRLFLPIPPKNDTTAIASVKINDNVLLSTDYKYYLRQSPDDRFNPKIYLTSGNWPVGNLNIEIIGDFGFVEMDGTPPPLIKHLCKLLTVWELPLMSDKSASRDSQIIEEELGDYRYKLGEVSKRGGGFFGDQQIDNILTMYKRIIITTV